MMRVTTVYVGPRSKWHAEVEARGVGIEGQAAGMAWEAIAEHKRPTGIPLAGIALVQRTSRDGVLTFYFIEAP